MVFLHKLCTYWPKIYVCITYSYQKKQLGPILKFDQTVHFFFHITSHSKHPKMGHKVMIFLFFISPKLKLYWPKIAISIVCRLTAIQIWDFQGYHCHSKCSKWWVFIDITEPCKIHKKTENIPDNNNNSLPTIFSCVCFIIFTEPKNKQFSQKRFTKLEKGNSQRVTVIHVCDLAHLF